MRVFTETDLPIAGTVFDPILYSSLSITRIIWAVGIVGALARPDGRLPGLESRPHRTARGTPNHVGTAMSDWAVELKDVTRTYRTDGLEVPALRGVDLHIATDEFLAIAGPSGSGKTTLLNIIGGLDRADDGQVRVAGQDFHTLSNSRLARLRLRHIGFVFQAYNLIPVLTARENAEFTLLLQGVSEAQRRKRIDQLFTEIGLSGLEDRRPTQLSGGQQQRVAVARAMATQPALILADEPTANLDSSTAAALLDVMAQLNHTHGTTFIFSTHDPQVMDRARRLIRLRDGRIVSDERQTSSAPES